MAKRTHINRMEINMKTTLILSALGALSFASTTSFAQDYVTHSSAYRNTQRTISATAPYGNAHPTIIAAAGEEAPIGSRPAGDAATPGVTCTPAYWSERDDWTLAMVAAGLGFAFMPANAPKHPGVVGLPVVEPEFWRDVNLVSVRGRPHTPGLGSLVRRGDAQKLVRPGCARARPGASRFSRRITS
jgi:hypothetical protein